MECDYVCMNKKVKRRKSSKSKRPVVRRVSVKVKRRRSSVRQLKQKSSPGQSPRVAVAVYRTKSFIVKRKSFRKPRRWSAYIREDEASRQRQLQCSSGSLPRIKGVWDKRKYKDLTLTRDLQGNLCSKKYAVVTRLVKSFTRQPNETNFEFNLEWPSPARRHMCFLWWHSCVKKQWIFTK